LFGTGIYATYKPILWFTKGAPRPFNARHLISATLDRGKIDKQLHPWQQDTAGIVDVVEKVTGVGELVLDPFCGTCTWGEVVARLGRRWIGCDLDLGGMTRIETISA
jgi:DNA modification methylase